MTNGTPGCKNFGRIVLAAILACAAFPLHTWAESAYEQLSRTSGEDGSPVVALPASAVPSFVPKVVPVFQTGDHAVFAKALAADYSADSEYGDYYPFVGTAPKMFGMLGGSGLFGGMGSEAGHPSMVANGGDPRVFWDSALKKYMELKFAEAYRDIGLVCHLTQDQAVPVHVANINHVVTGGDSFERVVGKNLAMLAQAAGNVDSVSVPEMKPYEYYQVLQDDTRAHLAGWTDPRTGLPYWPLSPSAPPMGQDVNKGPWSHYSNGRDTYDKAVSPEIFTRQISMAAVYTRAVLKSAAKLLPPVIGRIDSRKGASSVGVSLKVYDNRRGKITFTVERPLYGQVEQAVVDIESDGSTIPSGSLNVTFNTPSPKEGNDVVVVTARDADGNITKVSSDAAYARS